MSLLSSHRLHWGSHHELTDHFRIIVDHLMHPSAPGAVPPPPPAPAPDGDNPVAATPASDAAARIDALGP